MSYELQMMQLTFQFFKSFNLLMTDFYLARMAAQSLLKSRAEFYGRKKSDQRKLFLVPIKWRAVKSLQRTAGTASKNGQ